VQDRQELLDEEKRRSHVDREQAVEILDRRVLDRGRFRHAGVGDKDIEAVADDLPRPFRQLVRPVRRRETLRWLFPKEPNVGYETLIHDVMIGDQTLFMRADMVEQAWRIVQPVLDAWATEKAGVPNYDSGGDGPAAADELLARDGERIWRPVTTSLEQTS
jgi:hypothetical protein